MTTVDEVYPFKELAQVDNILVRDLLEKIITFAPTSITRVVQASELCGNNHRQMIYKAWLIHNEIVRFEKQRWMNGYGIVHLTEKGERLLQFLRQKREVNRA